MIAVMNTEHSWFLFNGAPYFFFSSHSPSHHGKSDYSHSPMPPLPHCHFKHYLRSYIWNTDISSSSYFFWIVRIFTVSVSSLQSRLKRIQLCHASLASFYLVYSSGLISLRRPCIFSALCSLYRSLRIRNSLLTAMIAMMTSEHSQLSYSDYSKLLVQSDRCASFLSFLPRISSFV